MFRKRGIERMFEFAFTGTSTKLRLPRYVYDEAHPQAKRDSTFSNSAELNRYITDQHLALKTYGDEAKCPPDELPYDHQTRSFSKSTVIAPSTILPRLASSA